LLLRRLGQDRGRRPVLLPMKIFTNLFTSSLGKKYLMAATGFILFLFVLGHLAGNLQIFLGPEAINRYGHFLQSNVELIWPARIALLLMLGVHLWAATKLSAENRAARPQAYARHVSPGSTYASRHMLMSGLVVLVFVIYHLLHYTIQAKAVNLTGRDFAELVDPEQRHDVFRMMVVGFSNGWVSGFYILGIGLLCLHLSHGASSMFQSLGWRNEGYRPALDTLARVVAVLVFLGYVSIPVAILLGYGK
jgi:succinate dehydrogenase / fumarate reductase cytochrome b subunit